MKYIPQEKFKGLVICVRVCGCGCEHAYHACRRHQRPGFDPWVRKIPWRRKWQPIPVFLLGEFYGQRSLAGHSPWGHKESDTTERLSTFSHLAHS